MKIEDAERCVILKILAGSHIHGLNVETSDRDEEAIIIEPIEYAMGLKKPFEELIIESDECDKKYVSLRKWCQLAAKGNPNFLLPLFAPSLNLLRLVATGGQLRELRSAFISKQAIKSHLGYLNGQRQRMLKGNTSDVSKGDGRGRPRQDLTEKFGYDTKYAMHLLRLAYQGRELAVSGKITLPLPTEIRNELLDVRGGGWTMQGVLDLAELWESEMKGAFDTSELPDEPDYAAIERFMLTCYIRRWSADRSVADHLEDLEVFGLKRGVDAGAIDVE
jgi:predicted nucleotidyltransferase